MELQSALPIVVVIGELDWELEYDLKSLLNSVGIALIKPLRVGCTEPEDIIARADTEGGTPIIMIWHERLYDTALLEALMTQDTLPGRQYILIVPSDQILCTCAEELEKGIQHAQGRSALIINKADLTLTHTRTTVGLHLSYSPAAYLGRYKPRNKRRVAALTELPSQERDVGGIHRRNMQRGMFRIPVQRAPFAAPAIRHETTHTSNTSPEEKNGQRISTKPTHPLPKELKKTDQADQESLKASKKKSSGNRRRKQR